MAISEGKYAFSGGAFMGGSDSEVKRVDIKTLTLKRNGVSLGNYNPIGDRDQTIDIESDGWSASVESDELVPVEPDTWVAISPAIEVPAENNYIASCVVAVKAQTPREVLENLVVRVGDTVVTLVNAIDMSLEDLKSVTVSFNAKARGAVRLEIMTHTASIVASASHFSLCSAGKGEGGGGGGSDVVVINCDPTQPTIDAELYDQMLSAIDSGHDVILKDQQGNVWRYMSAKMVYDKPDLTFVTASHDVTKSSTILGVVDEYDNTHTIRVVNLTNSVIEWDGTSQYVGDIIEIEQKVGMGMPLVLAHRFSNPGASWFYYAPLIYTGVSSKIFERIQLSEDKLIKHTYSIANNRKITYTITEISLSGGVIPPEVEDVIETVDKLKGDLDTKLTTTMPMAEIDDCYDMSNSEFGSAGNLITQAFTVPINNDIRVSDTRLGVYARQNYGSKVILGLYEFNFDGNNGTGQTKWVCDTGPVTIKSGRNEFPVKHISSDVTELKAAHVYYAAIFFPAQKASGCLLAGAPGYNGNVNTTPRFTVGADNLTIDITDPNASLETVGPWSSGYNERSAIPRFFMQIRNSDIPIVDPTGPFDNYTGFMTATRSLEGSGLPAPALQFGILCKKVIPKEDVGIIGFTYSDDRDEAQYINDAGKSIFNADGSVLATGSITMVGSIGDTYKKRVTFNRAVLLSNTVYWFPVNSNVKTLANKFACYEGDKKDDLRLYDNFYNMQYGPSNDTSDLNAFLEVQTEDGRIYTL